MADPLVVAWQIDDYRIFPSDYAAPLVKRFNIEISTSTGSPPQPGLSTGAKAGIGVGTALGFIAILGAMIAWCLVRRRKRKQQTAPEHTIPEMEDQDHDLAKKKWWAGGKWRSEVDTQAEQQEPDSKTVHVVPGSSAELDGAGLQHPNDTDHAVLHCLLMLARFGQSKGSLPLMFLMRCRYL